LDEIKPYGPRVRFGWKIIKSDPKSFIPSYLNQNEFSMIVMGSKGMSALKEMTVGSVAAHLMDRIHIPMVVVPPEVVFQKIKTVVLGVDEKPDSEEILQPLVELVQKTKAELELVHTYKEKAGIEPENISVHVPLGHLPYKFHNVPQVKTIPLTLMDFSIRKGADLLVLLHEHRTWWQRLFVNSLSKTELFDLRKPLMLLPE
ncbi:MAG: universal stress protein, partial [Bacteroidota bacterium]